ncbi:MAG TPA: helix-turn-helix domain-containing protein [Acidimicrobiia bacterium]|nr:helix-turn-helix domain-containing protein [Acidimicrobiia bacterium]
MEVARVRWPEDQERLSALRAAGTPRLLVVADGTPAPVVVDPLEDWVRAGTALADIDARLAALAARAAAPIAAPELDGDGLLRFRDEWVSLSPVEQSLGAALVERFGSVVGRDVLAARAWPHGAPTRNALDVHVLRLRRRIEPLGLEIKTVRSRGYLLQSTNGHTPH